MFKAIVQKPLIRFSLIAIVAFGLSYSYRNQVPILSWIALALDHIETFFHEFGHGFGAMISGGGFYTMKLMIGGGGVAATHGGSSAVSLFMGHLFPVLVGVGLYASLSLMFNRTIQLLPWLFSGFALFSALLWVRDFTSLLVILIIWLLFRCLGAINNVNEIKIALKTLALYLVFSGFCSTYYTYIAMPLYKKEQIRALMSSKMANTPVLFDSEKLVHLMQMTEYHVVMLWTLASVIGFICCAFFEYRDNQVVRLDGLNELRQHSEKLKKNARV